MELFPVNIAPGREQLDIIKNPAILRGPPSTAKLHVKLDRTRTRAPRAGVRAPRVYRDTAKPQREAGRR